jgi:acetyl esterase/lipase
MSWQLAALNLWLRFHEKPYMARERSIPAARARMEGPVHLFAMPPGAAVAETDAGGIGALAVEGPGDGLLLWFHGGAYCLGSPRTHVAMAAALARRAGLAALLPDYRLAPEHPFPAAVDDALAVWRALVAAGRSPGRIALGGDSAGGGLALALLHLILAEGGPAPACVVAFSPWVDLTLSGRSLVRLARRDAFLPAARVPEARDQYLVGADPRDPRASPVLGAFAGGPPVLIQASRAEILLDDARALADRLSGDGVAVTLDLWGSAPHVWQIYQGRRPEADAALDRAGFFLKTALARDAVPMREPG